jgi:phosphoribosylformylglycinamidine synthase
MNLQAALEMGLNEAEYQKVVGILKRVPTLTELGMFAVMWSEHCGYKYSRPVLSLFKNYKEAQETGALENAGVIPLDDELGIVFKMESHNHPSAVEPFQGAATGVGGILRDIFTMGARPVANLNSLRFGPLSDVHNRYLLEHVVAGIAHYGNCVGVPTVAGEIAFNPCYSGNPLVNAMAVGVVERKHVASAAAGPAGSPVIYVGSATGKDGIHGATFASVELGPDSESKRPNVQMGDPFTEKLLIEATLEALATGFITGIQDMGAAGLTCSTCEMSAKAGLGMDVEIRKVPLREQDMTSYEIMLSESQERMLCTAIPGRELDVVKVFRKWGLHAEVVGTVTDDGLVRIRDRGNVVAEVPARALTDECPTYYLEAAQPNYIDEKQSFDVSVLPAAEELAPPLTPTDCLHRLLDSPNIASKRWITEQYDSMVQTQTVHLPGADAAVLKIRGAQRGISMKVDGNSRYCYLDPFVGAQIAVVESARNVACTGAMPAAVTDNLNFANPEKPTGFWQFRRAVEGIAAATEAFGTPVVSGNVSFYNETPDGPIYPTPTIGMVGIIDDPDRACGAAFVEEGDTIVLLQAYDQVEQGIGGSEYLSVIHGVEAGRPPQVDLLAEKRLQEFLVESIGKGMFASCHDVSDGGLAVTLAECCMLGRVGALVLMNPAVWAEQTTASLLFGEAQGRVVVSLKNEESFEALKQLAATQQITAHWLGTVGGEFLRIASGTADLISTEVGDIARTWQHAIPSRMESAAL